MSSESSGGSKRSKSGKASSGSSDSKHGKAREVKEHQNLGMIFMCNITCVYCN